MRILICITPWLAASAARAHEGHTHGGSHWHATDTFGLIAAAIALLLWLQRK